jgi:vitamin B12 transporter
LHHPHPLVEGQVADLALDKRLLNLLLSTTVTHVIPRHATFLIVTAICLLLGVALPCARAEETEETTALFSAWQEQSSSSVSRAPKPLSQTAENVTVITRANIEALNAHTLSDVLETVPGLQVRQIGGPGSAAFTYINSMSGFFTQVFLDGAPLNNSGNYADVGAVPARIIERVEIVKGTASSSWGRALGGVINVITKSPDLRPVGGAVDASIGKRTTADVGAELSGGSGRVGYYLSGGYLGSDGLQPLTQRSLDSNNLYTKLTYDLPDQGKAWGTVYYSRNMRVDNYTTQLDFKELGNYHYLNATLGLNRRLAEQVELELNAHYVGRDKRDRVEGLAIPYDSYQKLRERVGGAKARLIWRGERQLLVAGFEYEHETFGVYDLLNNSDISNHKTDRFGFYLNDTITIGPLSLIPGARFDKTSNDSQFSPSLGATLRLGDNNLLRAYAGRGYSIAVQNNTDQRTEKVWTVQVGAESTSIPYLWLKGTLFRNEIWDVEYTDPLTYEESKERFISLGAEIEARTVPVFNTSLGAGYTFTDTSLAGSGDHVYAAPRHTVQLSLRYDDQTFRGQLTGRHLFWNAVPTYNGSYGGMIWDLHLGATLFRRENNSLEVFFSGRNLFDCDQYPDETQPNTGRWFEGGVRVRF